MKQDIPKDPYAGEPWLTRIMFEMADEAEAKERALEANRDVTAQNPKASPSSPNTAINSESGVT